MFAELPADLLKERLSDNGYIGETSNKCFNRPATYSMEADGEYTKEDVEEFIKHIAVFILRMKGFVKGKNTWWKVDVVDSQVIITETELGKRDVIKKTKLVVIGHDTNDFKNELQEAWKEIFEDTLAIFE